MRPEVYGIGREEGYPENEIPDDLQVIGAPVPAPVLHVVEQTEAEEAYDAEIRQHPDCLPLVYPERHPDQDAEKNCRYDEGRVRSSQHHIAEDGSCDEEEESPKVYLREIRDHEMESMPCPKKRASREIGRHCKENGGEFNRKFRRTFEALSQKKNI